MGESEAQAFHSTENTPKFKPGGWGGACGWPSKDQVKGGDELLFRLSQRPFLPSLERPRIPEGQASGHTPNTRRCSCPDQRGGIQCECGLARPSALSEGPLSRELVPR